MIQNIISPKMCKYDALNVNQFQQQVKISRISVLW